MKKREKNEIEEKPRKKPGRVANPNLVMTSVSLDADLLEWGKNQPGGLSALLRDLLRQAKEHSDRKKKDTAEK